MPDSVTVVDGPVKVDGSLLRIVKFADGSGRVERWDGSEWVPGGGDAAEIFFAPPASPETLAAFGVPA